MDEGVDIPALARALGWSAAELRLLGDLRDMSPIIELEVERRRLQTIYLDRLAEIVGYVTDTPKKISARQTWLMVTATPEQRARAFLAALEAM